jgi:copper chaperone
MINKYGESVMTTTVTYTVSGMTCAHCVSAVTQEVGQLDGVTNVDIDLRAGGDSMVTVTSAAPLSRDAVRDAVDEAGYTLAS